MVNGTAAPATVPAVPDTGPGGGRLVEDGTTEEGGLHGLRQFAQGMLAKVPEVGVDGARHVLPGDQRAGFADPGHSSV